MRIIKFRAWDKEKKEMREVTGINWYDEYLWVDETPMSGDKLLIESTPLMQFTGILDKNGKEIYEGDIIKLYEWLERDTYNIHPNLFQITYMDDCDRPVFELWSSDELWGKMPDGTERTNDTGISVFESFKPEDHYEIIGNIYENPELLN